MTANIKILTTGGTIASTGDDGGASPTTRGEELIASVPGLDTYADVTVDEIARISSFDMDWETIVRIGDAALAAADEVDGVVVTHGTDTMEESAYATDLTFDGDVPVVFTGAQRRPDETSPDGPSNLLTAVRAAADERLHGIGAAYVAFDEQLHSARDVTKTHTASLGTFDSPGKGPLAITTRNGLRVYRSPESYSVDLPHTVPTHSVRMVKSGTGVPEAPIREAIESGTDGIVLEGTGLGNATASLGDAVATAVSDGVPVVVTSRCHAGSTTAVYGGAGGGETLRHDGAIFADDLPAHKARLKLTLALETTTDIEKLRPYFGSYPPDPT